MDERRKVAMDWRKYIVSASLFGVAVIAYPIYSLSQINECPGEVDSVEVARSCYFDYRRREQALEIALQLSPSNEEKIDELNYYIAKADPLSLAAREKRLHLFLAEENASEVLREFRVIRKLDSEFFPPEKAAHLLFQSKNYSASKEILDKLLAAQPGNLEARKLRAVALFELREYKLSYEDLLFFAESGDTQDINFRIASARTLFELKRVEKARSMLQSLSVEDLAISQLPPVAELAEKLNEVSFSRAAYRRLLQSQFEIKWILKYASLLRKTSSNEECEELLRKAKEFYPDSPEIELARYQFNMGRGKLARAGSDLERFLLAHPEHTNLRDALFGLRTDFVDKKILAQIEKEEKASERQKKVELAKERAEEKREDLQRKLADKASEKLPDQVKITSVEPSKIESSRAIKSKKNDNKTKDRVPSNLASEYKVVKVKKRETLMKFSFRVHGTHQRWKEIFKLNKDKLESPDHVRPGMRLKVRNDAGGDTSS